MHGPGTTPLKLLLFGGGPAIGYGTTDHDLALAGHFARALARRLGRGVDLEVRVQKELGAVDVDRLSSVMAPTAYDAIIVTMGIQDAVYLDSDSSWARTIDSMLDALQNSVGTPVFFIALPRFSDMVSAGRVAGRILDQRTVRMNDRLRYVSQHRAGVHFAEFERVMHRNDLRERATSTYARWGEAMVDELGDALATIESSTCALIDEEARQRAVDELRILDTEPEPRFDRITAVAQQYFHTKGAAITLIDRDRQWFKSFRGFDGHQTSRDVALCDYTIRGDREFVVSDAREDRRFAGHPLVADEPGLRSYAGWPIDSPDGYHVGALCVFDTAPRTFTDSDIAFLRSLAMLAQNELARTA